MAKTPVSSSTPYCTADRLFVYHDAQMIADFLRDGDNPRPTRMAMKDTGTTEGAMLVEFLKAASGELDSACLAGKRYQPEDLLALTGTGLSYCEKLAAHLTFWHLAQRRQPNAADPNRLPGVVTALMECDRLRVGERIFAFAETQEAGLPDTVEPVKPPDQSRVTGRASRLFGSHGSN